MSKGSRAAKLPPESEGSLQQKVMQLAKHCGWRAVHFRPARTAKGWRTAFTGDPGFPDCVLVRSKGERRTFAVRTRLIIAELKRDSESPTIAQLDWLELLGRVTGVECYTWRPRDWEKIVEVLR